jgi:hypothetical protein
MNTTHLHELINEKRQYEGLYMHVIACIAMADAAELQKSHDYNKIANAILLDVTSGNKEAMTRLSKALSIYPVPKNPEYSKYIISSMLEIISGKKPIGDDDINPKGFF